MSKLFESLTSKAARVARQASLTAAANTIRRKIESEMLTLGRRAYELRQDGALSDPALDEPCQRIAGLEQELKQVEVELKALRLPPSPGGASASCHKCGAAVQAGQAFCVSCGAPITHCPHCGNPVGEQAQFCPSCGDKLEPTAGETPPSA